MNKVLIIRSAPASYLKDILPEVKDRFGDPTIEVLTNSLARPELTKFLKDDQIIIWPKEKFGILKMNYYLFTSLFTKFDAIIIPYTNLWGEGYRNVELFGLGLGARELWSVDKKGRWQTITPSSFLKKQVSETLKWVRYSIHWIVTLTRMALKAR